MGKNFRNKEVLHIDGEIIEEDEDILSDSSNKRKVDNTKESVFVVKLIHQNETSYLITRKSDNFSKDTHIIIESKYGKDLAIITGETQSLGEIPEEQIAKVVRIANESDINKYKANKEKEQDASRICKEKIIEHSLNMKLISTHYLTDEPKILFFFTADQRVDFRNLVKDLVAIFKMRIELRQVGVRDESRIVGGKGVCGRAFCCHSITDKLKPVSIKMAKEQNLSLNSLKISGPCGRLLCCMSYEYDFYKSEKKTLPRVGDMINISKINYKINDINVLTKMIRASNSDGGTIILSANDIHKGNKNNEWISNITIDI
ncbi:MAG: hypothetical protein JXR63_13795 [Spirochaetales bacterium]|nr:hypothetical protein [Spirochaetales bacterium]